MMGPEETTTLAVCAGATEIDRLVETVREAGSWNVIPIRLPDLGAVIGARRNARAYVLHSGLKFEPPADELVELLSARPGHMPLLVVGNEPARRAAPDMWLPALPAAGMLKNLITQLLDGVVVPDAAPTFRRKSDIIIGDSPPVQQLLHALDQLAPAMTPVLITGESGVGKELVARALHYASPRAAAPFIAINCAAIPESLIEAELFGYQRGAFTGAVSARAGAFEAAHNGTLFLDEIGEMPLASQAKLLRVLETGEVQRLGSSEPTPVKFRLVTATNRTLEIEVRAGRFREDLYYRVHVFPIHVPPLRERAEDIPRIATHYLGVIATRERRALPQRLTAAALQMLLSYDWPGNVRELVNLLERAALMAESAAIDAPHIVFSQRRGSPTTRGPIVPYRDAKTRFETEYFMQLMRTADGNITLAAKLARKTRKEIYEALKRCEITAPSSWIPSHPIQARGGGT